MKFNLKLILLLVVGAFISTSCTQSETNDKSANVPIKTESVENNESSSVIGIWVSENKGRWLEFLEDGTFNMGMEGKEDVIGKKYEIDVNKSVITIQTKKATKIFRYKIKGNKLLVTIDGNDKELKYTKSDSKPE